MDSVTQAVLGAVVADVSMGRQLGRRAAVWGLALGTLPDLDVLVMPWLSSTAGLSWHRGISHGILAMVILSPIIGWCLHRLHRQRMLSWRRASIAAALIWFTHVLIDCFNLYGTGIWEPISSVWASFNIMFIIDIFFTVPLIIATVAALCWSSARRWRLPFTWICIAVSCLYVGWAVSAKLMINQRFAKSLQQVDDRFVVQDWHSAPTPLNTILWRALAKAERTGEPGFLIGLASLADEDARVVWRWVPQIVPLTGSSLTNTSLEQTKRPKAGVRPIAKSHVGFAAVDWFSDGHWVLVESADPRQPSVIHDIRFGAMQLDVSPIDPVLHPWVFSWQLIPGQTGNGDLIKMTPLMRDTAAFPSLWARIKGYPYAWETAALLDSSAIVPVIE